MSLYITNTLNKVSSMAKAAKVAQLAGDLEKAKEIVYQIQVKMEFVEKELNHQSKVSA
jgi:hypothetical protein